jgi:hypothetical protein
MYLIFNYYRFYQMMYAYLWHSLKMHFLLIFDVFSISIKNFDHVNMHVNFYIYLIRWNVIVYVNGYENGNANRYDYGYDYLSALYYNIYYS